MTKNKLPYFSSYGSPYSRKQSSLSAVVCVSLWLKILEVFSVFSACQAIALATAGVL